ncbi:MFS transporter [Desulfurococcaceae archaeon MEX13E-LK6-19]|nr:MFS transporter [Desulfurococcaceae archaeon MEX13E-LK6-19]
MKNVERWLKAFAIAFLLEGLGTSIYFTYSRPYIIENLGEAYGLAALLASAELIPSIFSVVAGMIGDRIGRRNLILVGILRFPALTLLAYINPVYAPVAVALMYLGTALSAPSSLGTVLEAGGRSGKIYAWITFFAGIGWALGGLVPGIFKQYIGGIGLFLLAGIFLAISPIIQFAYYPKGLKGRSISLQEVFEGIKRSTAVVLAILFSTAGLTMFYSLLLVKIYREVGNLFIYGLVTMSLAALTGSLMRPLSGKLVDKYDPDIVLALSLIAYMILNVFLYISSGLILLVLWLVPIFPFKDTAQTMSISRRLPPELQATAAGIIATVNSIAGLLIAAVSPEIAAHGLLGGFIIQLFLLILSIAILYKAYKSAWKNRKVRYNIRGVLSIFNIR